jgi:hypothetical protein
VLDGHLKGRRYAACGRLTIADFHLASMATYWRLSEMPMEDRRIGADSSMGHPWADHAQAAA